MQKRNFGFIIVMLVAFALFLFYVPVQAAEFTADWFNIKEGVTYKGKIYVKGDMMCLESLEGPEPIIMIINQRKRHSIIMNPVEKYYIELPKNLSGLEPDKDRIIGTAKKHVGTETVNGLVCDKYQFFPSDSDRAAITQWVSKKLQYPVKIVYHSPGGDAIELKNIKEGRVDVAVFQVRPGYTKMEVTGIEKPSHDQKKVKVDEFVLKGEGRDTDMTSIERSVHPGQDLMIIITGDSRYRLESKGKFSIYKKGVKREKIKQVRFALKPGEEKFWDFPAGREIKFISFGVYGKGEIKVRIEQGAGGHDQAGKGQMTAVKKQPGPKPVVVQQTLPAPSGSFSSLIDDAKKSYKDGNKIETIKQLKAAVQTVWDEIPLTVINARLVKDTKNYVSRDSNVYRSGQKINITSQILGYKLKKVGEAYTINLVIDFYVLDENGKIMGGKESFAKLTRKKPIPVTDFDMDFHYTISYPKGIYNIQTIIHDQNSGKSTKFTMQIEIR